MADFDELMAEMEEKTEEEARTRKAAESSRKAASAKAEDNDVDDDDEDDEDSYERPSRPRKKRRKKHYLLRFLIFVAIVYGSIHFMSSDFFTVTEIKVEGNHFYTKAQVIEMTGLQTGCNLFFDIKTGPAKNQLLQDPYIRLVSVRKEYPGTLRITIEEREEYAAIPYGENYILIDEDGMVLRISDREPVLPLLTGLSLVEMKPGSPLQVEQPYMLNDTLTLIAEMDENDIYFKQIYFSAVVVKAYIYDNLYCEGTPENIKNSMGKVYELLTSLYESNITHGVIKIGSDDYIAYSPTFE